MNKFKVGDRVRTYYVKGNFGDDVGDSTEGVVWEIKGDLIRLSGYASYSHYKQCELIEEELHPQDHRGYGYGNLDCGIKTDPIMGDGTRPEQSKFKVGDFVWDVRKHRIGRVSSISCPKTNSVNVKFQDEDWLIWCSQGCLEKLNIRTED